MVCSFALRKKRPKQNTIYSVWFVLLIGWLRKFYSVSTCSPNKKKVLSTKNTGWGGICVKFTLHMFCNETFLNISSMLCISCRMRCSDSWIFKAHFLRLYLIIISVIFYSSSHTFHVAVKGHISPRFTHPSHISAYIWSILNMTTHLPLDLKTTHNQSVNESYKIVLQRCMLPRSGHAAIQTSDLFSVYDCGVLVTTMFLS
jgi:hypothetical protein